MQAEIATGYGCLTGEVFAGGDPDACVFTLRLAGSNCSVIQFHKPTSTCSCCHDVNTASADPDSDLFQVHLSNEFGPPPSPPAGPPQPPAAPMASLFFDFYEESDDWTTGPTVEASSYAMTRQSGETLTSSCSIVINRRSLAFVRNPATLSTARPTTAQS